MFFGNGVRASFLNLWATHPRLETRIRALDPDFDGRFPRVIPVLRAEPAISSTPAVPVPTSARASQFVPSFSARAVTPQVGATEPRHLRYAAELLTSLPEKVTQAAREPMGAATILYAVLLSDDPELQRKQLDELASATSTAVREETLRLLPEVREVATRAKLPLVNLALPALRELSLRQFREFRDALTRLVESDEQIDLFEYMLQKVVMRHLQTRFEPAPIPIVQYYALKPLAGDCAVLLSTLAHVGQDSAEEAERAFEQGARIVATAASSSASLLRPDEINIGLRERSISSSSGALVTSPEATFHAAIPIRSRSATASLENGELRNRSPRSSACVLSPCHCSSVNSIRFQ